MVSVTPIGELLVLAGFVTQAQVERVLREQESSSSEGEGLRFGELLVLQGLVTDAQLTQVLSQQLSIPWVSLRHIEFAKGLLELVPTELAEYYRVLPIHLRRNRRTPSVLYVATADPLDRDGLDAVAAASGYTVRPMIACQRDIAIALRTHYGVEVHGLPDVETAAPGDVEDLDDEVQESKLESIIPEPDSSPLKPPPPISRRAPPRTKDMEVLDVHIPPL
jgi:hypothetical protein